MISVIMPAYNSASFVQEAIESILRQTYTQLELIVVDDGSSDATFSIASSYVIRDSRVRVIQSDHGGPSRALNTGIQHARYDWVAIMHSDDVSLPFRLERQIKAAHGNPKVVAWGAYAYHIDSRGRKLGLSRVGPTTEEEFQEMKRRGQVVLVIHPTALMRKEAVIAAGRYDPFFDGSEELELFDRLATLGPILALPEPLLLYRIHKSSLSMQRFFQMRLFTRYVRARHRARIAGSSLPTWEEFLREYRAKPVFRHLWRKIDDLGQYCYRKAGVEYADRNYLRFLFYFGASACLNPKYALRRVWHQKLSQQI